MIKKCWSKNNDGFKRIVCDVTSTIRSVLAGYKNHSWSGGGGMICLSPGVRAGGLYVCVYYVRASAGSPPRIKISLGRKKTLSCLPSILPWNIACCSAVLLPVCCGSKCCDRPVNLQTERLHWVSIDSYVCSIHLAQWLQFRQQQCTIDQKWRSSIVILQFARLLAWHKE